MADPNYNPENVAQLKHVAALAQLTKSKLDTTIKSVSVSGGQINFYASTDGTGTALTSISLPEEIYLDQVGTELVSNFSWSALTYPNSTNPNLDGKTVLVLAVRGDAASNPTVKYNFVDMSSTIDISGKADKVSNATSGNIATLDANGNLTDSGKTFASNTDVVNMLNAVFGAGSIASI